MLCKKILNCPKIGIGISSLVFVLGLFFSAFFATDTFATSYVFTLDSSNASSANYLCGSGTDRSCSDYSWLTYSSTDGSYPPRFNFYFQVNFNSSSSNFYPYFSSSGFISLSSNLSNLSITALANPSYVNNGGTITFTLSSDSPFPSPSGTLNITDNGTFDVTSYASAVVDVPPIYGDYHDDLVNIYHAILICGAILLVIYFFYCIYRMIIKSTGGQ